MLKVALNESAQKTVKKCLFATCLFTLSIALNLNLTGLAQGFTKSREMPIHLDDLIGISESMNTEPSNRWAFVETCDCRLFLGMPSAPLDQLQTDSTCPFELMMSENGNSSLSTRPVWLAIKEFTITHQNQFFSAMKQTSRTAYKLHAMINSSVALQLESFGEHIRCQRALTSARKLVPAILNLYRSKTEDELAILAEIDAAGPQSLIKIIGQQQDSYWQYYEDCDRWGVEFTLLLDEARMIGTAVCSPDAQTVKIVTDLNTDSDFDLSSSRFPITQFLVWQHVGSWLENSYLKKQAWNSFLAWLRGAKSGRWRQPAIASGRTTLSK